MGILKEKKEKLGINTLDYENQKKLYDDFIGAGGQVVELKAGPQRKLNDQLEKWIQLKEEEQKKRLLEEQRKTEEELMRQKALAEQEKLQKLLAQQAERVEKKEEIIIDKAPPKIVKIKEPNPTQDFFSRLAAKIVCMLYGVIHFFGNNFNRTFLDMTLFDLKNGLIECQQILVSLLHQDKAFSIEERRLLKESGYPFYYELIYRFYMIFEEEIFNLIRELRTAENPLQKGKYVFVKLFKKILVLSRYHPSLFNAFERALSIEKKLRHLADNVVDLNLRKLYHCYHFLFYKYYSKILNLVDFYYKDELFIGRKMSYSEFVGITEVDNLGYYTKLWEEEEAREKQKKEQKEKIKVQEKEEEKTGEKEEKDVEIEEEMKNLTDEVAMGIGLIRDKVNFQDIIQYYEEIKDPRMSLPVQDKAFLTGTLLEFFDKEFSFLFIASNVQFNIFFDRGQRKDIKSALKDLYFHIDDVYKRLYEYVRVLSGMEKVKDDSFIHSKEKFSKLQQLSFQRSMISRAVRTQTQNIIGDFQKNLQIVLEDYKKEKHYIQNPDEILNFDTRVAGKKVYHKETVVEIFKKAYAFSSAIYFLLHDGELGGAYVTLKNPVYLRGIVPPPEEGGSDDLEEM